MSIKLAKAEKTTSLADLQDRLQQVEDSGDLLVSLSTQTLSDGTDWDVAAFSEGAAKPPIGRLELFTEPLGMTPDREAIFYSTVESNGSTLVDISSIFIEGSLTRVLACRQPTPKPPQPVLDAANQPTTGASNTTNGLAGSQDALSKLLVRAQADVGVLSTSDDPGTDHGQLGCADAVTRILHDELGFSLPKTLSTVELFDELVSAGWIKVDLRTPGAVIVSPSCAVMHGHTGIVGNNGAIYSNSSATGRWTQNWTVDGWVNYYSRCGFSAFAPPPQAAPNADGEQKPIGFAPLGAQAPIRGQFSISGVQIKSLCNRKLAFAPYGLYADAIVEDSAKNGINPLFVLADLINQGVNTAYRNPWGISTDDYPHGPDGRQLGKPNGRIKNGPRQFAEDEWRIAFDRQFSIVASSKAYANSKTIAEWALVDAPPGAENDVHGTNAQEGADVGALYDKLVAMLT
jgi:hypothetical protein